MTAHDSMTARTPTPSLVPQSPCSPLLDAGLDPGMLRIAPQLHLHHRLERVGAQLRERLARAAACRVCAPCVSATPGGCEQSVPRSSHIQTHGYVWLGTRVHAARKLLDWSKRAGPQYAELCKAEPARASSRPHQTPRRRVPGTTCGAPAGRGRPSTRTPGGGWWERAPGGGEASMGLVVQPHACTAWHTGWAAHHGYRGCSTQPRRRQADTVQQGRTSNTAVPRFSEEEVEAGTRSSTTRASGSVVNRRLQEASGSGAAGW